MRIQLSSAVILAALSLAACSDKAPQQAASSAASAPHRPHPTLHWTSLVPVHPFRSRYTPNGPLPIKATPAAVLTINPSALPAA